MIRALLLFGAFTGVLAVPARAVSQTAVVPATGGARVDSVAHRFAVDSTRLQAARFVYRSTLVRDSVPSTIGDQQFAVTPMDYAGTPAWMLAAVGQQGVVAMVDSLVVRRADLQPLHWTASLGVTRLAVEFTRDTVFGAMSSPLGKQNLVFANRADMLVNTMEVDVLLASVPLAIGWRDSASVLVVDAGGAAVAPAMLVLEGEEPITVPAGEFDCWIVSLESERGAERLWVSKLGQVVVRSEQILPQLGGAVLRRELVQTDNPALVPASARLPH